MNMILQPPEAFFNVRLNLLLIKLTGNIHRCMPPRRTTELAALVSPCVFRYVADA
jgi:hypothetical protein